MSKRIPESHHLVHSLIFILIEKILGCLHRSLKAYHGLMAEERANRMQAKLVPASKMKPKKKEKKSKKGKGSPMVSLIVFESSTLTISVLM